MQLRDPNDYRANTSAHCNSLRPLKLLKVSVKHGPKERILAISGMTREGASSLTFTYKEKQISVADYFLQVM